MKIRKGFVSNSSTTSFCLMGVYLNSEDEGYDEADGYDCHLFKEEGFSSYHRPFMDSVYIGLSVDKMEDDETKEEFQQRAKEGLDEIGVEKTPGFITDAWRDG